jgi:hypothetical protein
MNRTIIGSGPQANQGGMRIAATSRGILRDRLVSIFHFPFSIFQLSMILICNSVFSALNGSHREPLSIENEK